MSNTSAARHSEATAPYAALPAIRARVKSLVTARYGTYDAILNGIAAHTIEHTWEVEAAAGRLAHALVDQGVADDMTPYLAEVGAAFHDVDQGHGHEDRNADLAAAALTHAGFAPVAVERVRSMVLATRVTGFQPGRIIQAADPNNLDEALLADADLAGLGGATGVLRALYLHLERLHLAGELVIPDSTDGTGISPDPARTLTFLRNQRELIAGHKFLLPVTRRLFPHQQANADALDALLERYEADRIDYTGMLIAARALAQ